MTRHMMEKNKTPYFNILLITLIQDLYLITFLTKKKGWGFLEKWMILGVESQQTTNKLSKINGIIIQGQKNYRCWIWWLVFKTPAL